MSSAEETAHKIQRGELTKDAILRAALRIADAQGIAALTTRRIADELGLSTMSLYRHVETKEDILHGLEDLAWEILDYVPEPDVDWVEHLLQTFMHIHRSLLEHPALVDIIMLEPNRGAHVYRAIERVIQVLRDAGFDLPGALLAISMLESYTLGFTVQQRVRSGRNPSLDHSPLFKLPPETFPNLSAAPEEFAGWANEERFVAGLRWLLDRLREG